MSGGSYDYFYGDVFDQVSKIAGTLEEMSDDTTMAGARLGAPAVLLECSGDLLTLAREVRMIAQKMKHWEETLKAIEWHASGDWTAEGIVEAYRKMRACARCGKKQTEALPQEDCIQGAEIAGAGLEPHTWIIAWARITAP